MPDIAIKRNDRIRGKINYVSLQIVLLADCKVLGEHFKSLLKKCDINVLSVGRDLDEKFPQVRPVQEL